jgi:hypothetical protein
VGFRAAVVALCMVDERGERLFTGDEGVAALNRKAYEGLEEAFEVAARISRLSKADQEELVGNSDAAPGSAPSAI